MAESPMVGARVPQEWVTQIRELARTSGRKEVDIVREALAAYLGKTDPHALKGALADHEERLAKLEAKLSGLGRLVG